MGKAEEAKGNIEKHNISETTDEIGKEMKETTIKNLYKEKETFEQLIEDGKKSLENYSEQWEVDKRIWEIRIENPKQIEPTYEYHNHPEIWDLIKKKMEYGFRQEKVQAEGTMNRLKKQVEAGKEQLEAAIKKLKEMGEEL